MALAKDCRGVGFSETLNSSQAQLDQVSIEIKFKEGIQIKAVVLWELQR